MKRFSKSLPIQFVYTTNGRHILFVLTVLQLNVFSFKIHVDTFMFLFRMFTDIHKEIIGNGTVKDGNNRREPNQTNKDVVPYGNSRPNDGLSRKTLRRRDQAINQKYGGGN